MGPKKISGSYEHEIAKRSRWIWLFCATVLIFAIGLVAFLLLNQKKEVVKTGQDLKNSISSLENRYVSKKIEFNVVNRQDDWSDINTELGPTYGLNNSSCKITLISSDNVKTLVNSGSTLDSAINNQLEKTKDLSPDKNIVVGNTYSDKLISNKGDVEFMIKDAEYKASDGTTHSLKVYGQWIGDYQLFIRQDCSAGDFNDSKEKLESFINNLEIKIN